jgi:hypothetical protein
MREQRVKKRKEKEAKAREKATQRANNNALYFEPIYILI